MKAFYLLLLPVLVLGASDDAPQEVLSKKERDRQAILAMVGDYVVDFHFKETLGFALGYEIKPAYDAAALEAVFVAEESENKIVLQHVLQTEKGVVKHWRQDWEWENRNLHVFVGEKTWETEVLSEADVKGTWTQKVYQVDDSLRYQGIGTWVHRGNMSEWVSNDTMRPLPRREYTKRDDYNLLLAVNRHAITPTGWVHEQTNTKIRKDDAGEHVIAREFGLNTYDRTHESRVAKAREYWETNHGFWARVRNAWDQAIAGHDTVVLAGKIDDKSTIGLLFDLVESQPAVTQEELVSKIRPYVNKGAVPGQVGTGPNTTDY